MQESSIPGTFAIACAHRYRVCTRYLWKIPLGGSEIFTSDALAPSQRMEAEPWGVGVSDEYRKCESSLALGSHSEGVWMQTLQCLRAPRVSFWTPAHRAPRELALAIEMFHSGCILGSKLSLEVWEQKYPTWVVLQAKQKKRCLRC